MNPNKLGWQAPKGWRTNEFQYINIEGDLHYCSSHNFVYSVEAEEEKLYNGLPCIYTDSRYKKSSHNSYRKTHLAWNRKNGVGLSLKSCIRKTLSCRNIPAGTIVSFQKDWYYPRKKFSGSYKFKVRNENFFDPKYQINKKSYFKNFTTCERSQRLVEALRSNGFLVSVDINSHNVDENGKVFEEYAQAFGYGKTIGFSSYGDSYYGYTDGIQLILWDYGHEFCKWSTCKGVGKEVSIKETLKILKS